MPRCSTSWSSAPGRCWRSTPTATSTTRPTASAATTSTAPMCGCSPSRSPTASAPSGRRAWPQRSTSSRWSAPPTAPRSRGDGPPACWPAHSPSSSACSRSPSAATTRRPPVGGSAACRRPPMRCPTGSPAGWSTPTSTALPTTTGARSGDSNSPSTCWASWPGRPPGWRRSIPCPTPTRGWRHHPTRPGPPRTCSCGSKTIGRPACGPTVGRTSS